MTPLIIAFLGISGVGKSTFLRDSARTMSFQHLTAGYLIGQARDAEIAHDYLRLQNISDNQDLLVKGFQIRRDAGAACVVLDGHAVIDGASGLEMIDVDIFRRLGVNAVAHLEADPQQIFANREGDGSRARPVRSADELREHQNLSLARSMAIAREMTIPFARLQAGETEAFALVVQNIADSNDQLCGRR
ncbi:P-loop NTPase domain-containing protein (plasmid) [Rhizobium etli bv. mimosae str. IE4771]|uniref:P-loop NTPase domain-containing protein n=1 Tax=Rhizobium etli bv. mimosae str. IE4771 TaxID=1432050 RepID=A0A060I7A0_RHIET|nr:AAA family ATPase [Rhizobium sp. IE4771]AIC29757.1 P-loop NTPase domain-containing protein [Rhizobium sp. IE4771]